jgi:hypothetical protein
VHRAPHAQERCSQRCQSQTPSQLSIQRFHPVSFLRRFLRLPSCQDALRRTCGCSPTPPFG